jgi:lysophospholipase L1-like esterase
MRLKRFLPALLPGLAEASVAFFMLTGCAGSPRSAPASSSTASPAAPAAPTGTPAPPTATATATATSTSSPTPTATRKWPLTIVFYGDSLLKIGEVGREAKWSYSFVDDLQEKLDPAYALITANYGGRDAAWGAENLEADVLAYRPDSVTLWWGFNDLLGCGGFFSRKTNKVIPENLENLVQRHIQGLRKQVDLLLEEGSSVMLLTSIPVDGKLPWTHFDEDNRLVWEWDYQCDYNIGLERLASEQRAMVEQYAAEGKGVFLVDLWQLFLENGKTAGMYLDLMHPGPVGADRIADEWIRVFAQTGALLRLR